MKFQFFGQMFGILWLRNGAQNIEHLFQNKSKKRYYLLMNGRIERILLGFVWKRLMNYSEQGIH